MCDQDDGLGVIDLVPNLALGLGKRQRHGNAARPPDAPLDGHIVESTRHKKHDPRALEVISTIQQRRCNPLRSHEQVSVGEGPLGRNDYASRGEGLGSLDDGNGHGEGALFKAVAGLGLGVKVSLRGRSFGERPMKQTYAVVFEQSPNNYSAYVSRFTGREYWRPTWEGNPKIVRETITFHVDGMVIGGEPC